MKNDIWEGKHGPLLIAEIGGNHEGDFAYAKKLTKLAIASGSDYVKFQIYSGDGLVNPIESPLRNKHFKRFELSFDQHIELAKLCRDNQVGYLASVWEKSVLSWIDGYLDFYKIGSGDLTAYPLIRDICKLRKPILISTGLATEIEVIEAVRFIKSCDSFYLEEGSICILQCTSMYPIPSEDANLCVMDRLRTLTSCPVGYSDHTEGSYGLEIAVAMGAQVLEYHFTDERQGKEFRDHKVSLTKSEVLALIEKIKIIKSLQGTPTKAPLAVEGDHLVSFRRAVYPAVDISHGTIIKQEHLHILRPCHGLSSIHHDKLIGKKASLDLFKNQVLSWDHFN
ncbi:MAG: N-acetylneuraminate synthase family protein [Cyclobacteriaceae bacterium]